MASIKHPSVRLPTRDVSRRRKPRAEPTQTDAYPQYREHARERKPMHAEAVIVARGQPLSAVLPAPFDHARTTSTQIPRSAPYHRPAYRNGRRTNPSLAPSNCITAISSAAALDIQAHGVADHQQRGHASRPASTAAPRCASERIAFRRWRHAASYCTRSTFGSPRNCATSGGGSAASAASVRESDDQHGRQRIVMQHVQRVRETGTLAKFLQALLAAS